MQNNQQPVDTIIEARWVIPIDPIDVVYEHHSLIINQGLIEAVIPTQEAKDRYTSKHHFTLSDHVVFPGLINLHAHSAMSLMRGLADDLTLMDWLKNHIWPAEAKHVSEQFVYDGTLLACAEMLRGGTTCCNDMYFFPQASARAMLDAHMRAAIGMIIIDFPTAYASNAHEYLNKGLAMRDEFRHEDLLSFCMAPHAPYTVSDESFHNLLTYADELEVPIHIHVHETQDEIQESILRFGMRPLRRLHQLNLLGPNLLAVHGVHFTPDEIAMLGEYGCHLAHCPTSNMKLASGIAPITELLESGVNIGFGTDGAASNNRIDMFSEMRQAALLAKVASGAADALPAHQALRMATYGAACALGLEEKIGSLSPNKHADICAVNLSNIEANPCFDPASHLVYVSGREHVTHVWVNGELLVDNGRLTKMDTQALRAKTEYWQRQLMEVAV